MAVILKAAEMLCTYVDKLAKDGYIPSSGFGEHGLIEEMVFILKSQASLAALAFEVLNK